METITKHQESWAALNHLDRQPKFIIRRFDDGKGNRFYYWIDGKPVIGAGITTILSTVTPESPELTSWKIKHGKDFPRLLNLAATYGTAMHECIQQWLIERSISQLNLDAAINAAVANGQNPKMVHKDIASFMKFEEDYLVEPLLIEAILPFSTLEGNYGVTAMDFVCKMTTVEKFKEEVQDGFYIKGDKKGQPKFITQTNEVKKSLVAAIDFKSNFFEKDKKSFFESHKFQLIAGRKALKENFDLEVNNLYNWAPNNWRTEPSYTLFKWNFDKSDIEMLNLYFKLADIKGAFTPKGTITIVPEKYTENTTWRDVKFQSYEEFAETLLQGINIEQ
jgi:hypothetical protein